MDKVLADSSISTAGVALDARAAGGSGAWSELRRGWPDRRATTLLIVAGVAGGATAAAGALPLTAAVIFATSFYVGLAGPASAPALLALLLPLGFSVASVRGVQIPLLQAAVVGCGAGYALGLYRSRRRPELRPADLAFAVVVAGVALSGAGPVGKAEWLHDLALWGGLGLVFHCGVRALAERAARRRFYAALAVTSLVEAVYAITQYVQGFDSRFSRISGAIVYPQPEATLQHPNSLGGFLVLAVLVLLGAALAERGRARSLELAVVLVLVLGTAAPFSRGAWISLGAGLVALVVAGRRYRRPLGVAAGALVVAATAVALLDRGPLGERLTSVFNGDTTSLYGFRATLVRRALDAIAHHPLTGAGRFLERGVYADRPTLATHPHDMLLGVAVFFGIPAAVGFTVLLGLAVRAAWRASRSNDASLTAEGAGVFAALVALIVNGLLEYQFWNSALTVEIALLLTLAIALGHARQATLQSSLEPAPP